MCIRDRAEATAARRVAAMGRRVATAPRATTGRRDTARGIAADRATMGSAVSDRAADNRAATAEDDRPTVAPVVSGVRDTPVDTADPVATAKSADTAPPAARMPDRVRRAACS